ncbi:MAG TPA: hypothetical protein VKA26_11150 [Ignavibacteriaceae bacterium]|nr:hypothetical protein [Ignavibacteriaceae bacterium]
MSFQPKTKAILFLSAIIFFVMNILLNAQSDLNEKINDIKGRAQKVTVKTDNGEVTFEGKEAEEIVKIIERNKGLAKFWVRKLDNDTTDPDKNIFFGFDLDKDTTNDNVKMKIRYDKGENTIIITKTEKDGNETTETFSGDEADEYFKKHSKYNGNFKWIKPGDKKDNFFFFKKDDGDDDEKGMDISIWNVDDDSDDSFIFFNKDDDGIKKMIKISEEDGIKKITVTSTDKDGQETTKTYKGKEAEEYLEKNDIKVKIKKDGDDDENTKEIIIRKKKSK